MDAGHLSGRRVDGLYLCPRSKNPTRGADGIRMESVHPCSLLEATLRASRPKWEVQCTLSPPRVARHGCVETLEAVEAMPLPGPAQWQRRHCQQRDLLSVPQPGGNVVAAWLRDCRSHISEQTGDLYRGRYPCTYRPSSGGGRWPGLIPIPHGKLHSICARIMGFTCPSQLLYRGSGSYLAVMGEERCVCQRHVPALAQVVEAPFVGGFSPVGQSPLSKTPSAG